MSKSKSASKPADKSAAKPAAEDAQHPFVALAVALTNFVRFPSSPRPQTLSQNIDAALARVKAEGVVGEGGGEFAAGETLKPIDHAAEIKAAVDAALPDLVKAAVAEALPEAVKAAVDAAKQGDLLSA